MREMNWIGLLVFLPMVAMMAGCERFRFGEPPVPEGEGIYDAGPLRNPDRLAADLEELWLTIDTEIISASHRLEGRNLNAEQQRHLAEWRDRLPARYASIFTDSDAANALARAWLFSLRLSHFLRDGGGGSTLFGEHQGVVRDASANILGAVDALARDQFAPADYRSARTEVDTLARENPIRRALTEDAPSGLGADVRGSVNFLASVPLIPFRTVDGITRRAGGFVDAPSALAETARVARGLPEESRLQAESLYFTIQSSDMATSTMMNMDRFATVSERLTTVSERMAVVTESLPGMVEKLPSEIAAALVEAINETAAAQEEFRLTLAEARDTITSTEALAAETRQLLHALEGASDSLTRTSDSVGRLMEKIGGMGEGRERNPDATPFDINDYTRALGELALASGEIRETILAVESLVERDDLVDRRAALLREEGDVFLHEQFSRANELVDRIFNRLMQLLSVLFVFIAALVFLKWILTRRSAAK